MTARIFSDTIELGRTLIDLGDGYAGESVNAAPVLPGRFEVTFQLDGEGAAALDHLLAVAALKVRPSMPPVRSIAQVIEHLKACGYEVTPDEWAPPGYIDLGWIAGGRCRVRDTHVRISGPWGRAYVEGEAATGRFDWYLSDHGRAVHLLGLAGCPVALPMPPENWQNSADPCAGGLRRAPPRSTAPPPWPGSPARSRCRTPPAWSPGGCRTSIAAMRTASRGFSPRSAA